MAVTTRGITTPKTPAAKASLRPKTSSTAKAAKRTKSTPKAAPKPALTQPPIQVKTTPSPETVIPDETDIKASKDYKIIRRLIISELAKIMLKPVTTNQANIYRVYKSHSRRRYRRDYRYSSKLSTDSEKGDRLIVLFLYYNQGTQLFLKLAA